MRCIHGSRVVQRPSFSFSTCGPRPPNPPNPRIFQVVSLLYTGTAVRGTQGWGCGHVGVVRVASDITRHQDLRMAKGSHSGSLLIGKRWRHRSLPGRGNDYEAIRRALVRSPPLAPVTPSSPTPRLSWQSRSSRLGVCVDRRHPCWWCVDAWCWLLLGAGGVVSAFRRSAGVSSSGCSRVGLGRACAQGARATVALLRSSWGRGIRFSLVRSEWVWCGLQKST